jgi:hypothetical protein
MITGLQAEACHGALESDEAGRSKARCCCLQEVVGMQLQLRADDPGVVGRVPGPDLLLFLPSEAIYKSPHQFATAVLRCVSSAFTVASARHKAGRQAAVVDSLLYVWR